METSQYEEREQSNFNADVAKLERLHWLKTGCITSREKGDKQRWVSRLLCFRDELNPKMNSKEKESADVFEKELAQYEPCKFGRCHIDADIYEIVLYQRLLFGIQARLGLEMTMKGSKGDSIADME